MKDTLYVLVWLALLAATIYLENPESPFFGF